MPRASCHVCCHLVTRVFQLGFEGIGFGDWKLNATTQRVKGAEYPAIGELPTDVGCRNIRKCTNLDFETSHFFLTILDNSLRMWGAEMLENLTFLTGA